jgi:alkylation response protein AidB-like acyl-CoA dehydrogenase
MASTAELLKRNEALARDVLAPAADDVDQNRSFPRKNIEAVGQAGLLGLLVPREYGGAGGGLAEMSQALATMAEACASTAMVVLMHYCGAAAVAAKGSARLKNRVLPEIAMGKHLSTLAFSEAGSGVHFYFPVSEVSRNGLGKSLSARKSFVTSAGEADSYVVSTRQAGASHPTDIDLYLLSGDAPGFRVEGRFEGMGLAGNASAAVTLERVPVQDESLLGAEGSGFATLMEVVLPHFQIGAASVSLGIASGAFRAAAAHVGGRKYEYAGKPPLSSIPRVQFLAAEMAMELRSARAYLAETLRRATSGDPEAMLDVLGIKARAAEACTAVVARAMTLGGGAAFGRRGGLERMFRDAQAAAVMAPSTDVLKEFLGKVCLGLPLF